MDYVPLYISLAIIFMIGVGVPLLVSDFIDTTTINQSSLMTPLVNFVQDGVSIFGFNLDLFGFLGDTLQNALVGYLTIFTYINDIILIPLIIIMITGIVYTVIKVLPTT